MYIIKCWNDEEEFIKIGKTYRTVGKRYRECHMPYRWERISEVVGEAKYVSELEKDIHKVLKDKDLQYIPAKKFEGMFECFSIKSLKELNEYITR